jgi:hypothetical protein
MLLHRGPEHLGREAQEVLPDVTHEHNGPFHQPRDLGQQAAILDHLEPLREGFVLRVVPDVVCAFLGREDHPRLLELRRVVVEARHPEALRRHEAVARRGVARHDPVDVERHDFGATFVRQDAEDRMERPDPAQADPPPQRIDLGQGKARIVRSSTSATIAAAGRPGRSTVANQTSPLPVSRRSS